MCEGRFKSLPFAIVKKVTKYLHSNIIVFIFDPMKDFRDMTEKEFRGAQKRSDLIMWSKYAVFARSVAGFNIFYKRIAIPKFIIFEKFKHYPRQLELIADGYHPDYRKKPNYNFDKAKWNLLEIELESGLPLGTDLKCSNTVSDNSTSTPPKKSE